MQERELAHIICNSAKGGGNPEPNLRTGSRPATRDGDKLITVVDMCHCAQKNRPWPDAWCSHVVDRTLQVKPVLDSILERKNART